MRWNVFSFLTEIRDGWAWEGSSRCRIKASYSAPIVILYLQFISPKVWGGSPSAPHHPSHLLHQWCDWYNWRRVTEPPSGCVLRPPAPPAANHRPTQRARLPPPLASCLSDKRKRRNAAAFIHGPGIDRLLANRPEKRRQLSLINICDARNFVSGGAATEHAWLHPSCIYLRPSFAARCF